MKVLTMILRLINPYVWYRAYRHRRLNRRVKTVSEFAHKHRELVIIVLDPVEDTMYLAHRDKQVLSKIKTADGRNHNVVKNVVKASQFKGNIDYLLTAVLEGMKSSLSNPYVMQFIKWLDAAVYRVGIDLKLQKEEKVKRKKDGNKV